SALPDVRSTSSALPDVRSTSSAPPDTRSVSSVATPAAPPVTASPASTAQVLATASPAAPAPATPAASLTWDGLVEHFRPLRPRLTSLLESASSHTLPGDGQELQVRFNPANSFKAEQLKQKDLSDEVAAFCTARMGRTVRLSILVDAQAGESQAQKREREGKEREEAARAAVTAHPAVQEARALFGGELGPVERMR
ncbi:MAG TPA: hypothetical protein VL588_06235, partial [Bdellovibrionota bacterium]|nr:hypothetical protein [Bdellovibrionota bacterium]